LNRITSVEHFASLGAGCASKGTFNRGDEVG